jgi:hypothetical protein
MVCGGREGHCDDEERRDGEDVEYFGESFGYDGVGSSAADERLECKVPSKHPEGLP